MSRDAPVDLALIRATTRYYVRQRRWAALARALYWTVIRLHGSELCEQCGRSYVTWHATQPLWERVRTSSSGLLCPRCFEHLAEKAGVRTVFVAETVDR